MKIEIIHEEASFLVIHKPHGLNVHREHASTDQELNEPTGDSNQVSATENSITPSLIDVLKAQINHSELYLVHRLDKETSGVMVIAKTLQAAQELGDSFESRRVRKCYLAISHKKPSKKQGKVVGDMAKARGGSYKLLRSRSTPAITQFYSSSLDEAFNGTTVTPPKLRVFTVFPLTGKTHQIRVALKAVGAPILGDLRYGSATADRMYLHAWALAFEIQGKSYAFSSLPKGEVYERSAFLTYVEQTATALKDAFFY